MGANAHNDYADRKNGRKPIEPIHPELAEALADILDETHGLIVYQEQVMAIAQRVAGYTLGAADLLRRAMGKKKREILDKEYVPFSEGMRASGYGDAAIKTLWDILVPFSDYAFNKAHSAGYGLVSYWTAFLKAQLPGRIHGGAADERPRRQGQDRHLPAGMPADGAQGAAARRQRLRSRLHPAGHRHPLRARRDPQRRGQRRRFAGAHPQGQGPLRRLRRLPAQGRAGRLQQADGRVADQGRGVRLARPPAARAGADPRRGDRRCLEVKRAEAAGQFSLFGGLGARKPIPAARRRRRAGDAPSRSGEWDKKLLLAYEREMLGLYVSDHPLLGVEHILAAGSDATVADLAESCDDGQIVTVGGIVASITRKVTKTGSPWAVVQLEDLDGGVETLVFPQTYAAGLPPADRGRGRAGQGPGRQARGHAAADRHGADRPGSLARVRAAR